MIAISALFGPQLFGGFSAWNLNHLGPRYQGSSHSYHACCACRESVVPQGTGSVMNGQMIDYALAGNFTKLPTGQSPRQMQKRTDVMAIHRRRRVHSGSTLLWQCFKCVFVMIKFGSARSLMR